MARCLLALALLAWPSPATALSSSPVSSDPVFKALLVDGSSVSGRIVSLGPGSITLVAAEGARHDLSLDRLVKLTRDATTSVAGWEGSHHALLPEGDRLMRLVVGSATETTLEVQSHVMGKLAIPLDCLAGLILSPPSQLGAFEALWDKVQTEPRTTEVVWLINGDRLAGNFIGLDDRMIKIQIEGKPVEVDRAGALALGFDPGLINYPRPKGNFIEVTLSDGTRLGVTDAKLIEGSVLATTRFGQPIRFPLGELVRVTARNSTVVYLSERKSAGVQYVSFVGPTRPIRIDRTVDGHPFQLAGQSYDRGIGTQSRTLLAYRLEPGDRRFQATVGVDERAGSLGSVVFRVLVDGKERFKTPPMTDKDVPKAIDLDLAGAKLLILVTEFGDRGDVRDLADWVEARIIR